MAKNRRAFELRLGKLGLILFVGGISVLLFGMFLLGVLVGKQMEAYPEKYSAGLAQLVYERLFVSAPPEGKAPRPAETAAKREPAASEEGFGLTFYNTLAGNKGGKAKGKASAAAKEPVAEVPAPAPALTIQPAPPEPPPVAAGGATASADPSAVGREGADGKKSPPPPEKRAAPQSGAAVPPSPPAPAVSGATIGKGAFEVQVAAYQESRKAERISEKLGPLGFRPQVVIKELPGKGKWYRVIVGGFFSREEAKTAADQIAGKIPGVKCVVRPSSP